MIFEHLSIYVRAAGLRVAIAALSLCVVAAANVRASIESYSIVETFSVSDSSGATFSASWLHSARSALNGSVANGAYRSGALSSRVAGSLQGDLQGQMLRGITGGLTGQLKQLSDYLNCVFSPHTPLATDTPFELRLGGASTGGRGTLQFETNGAGTGEFTGGFIDFSLYVTPDANVGPTNLLDGTLFFKPQAEAGSAALGPNRGNSDAFTLWGVNWMHDGAPIGQSGPGPDWDSFLEGLGYTGGPVLRTRDDGSMGILASLGIALRIERDSSGDMHHPEPTAALIWGALAMAGSLWGGRGMSRKSRAR